MSEEHTLGTWEVVKGPLFDEEHKQFCSITDSLGRCIAQTPAYPQGDQRTGSPYERKANEANARLIAAAPELLEACRRASEVFEYALSDPAWLQVAEAACHAVRQAIARAEGP